MTEENADAEDMFKSFVMPEQEIIVRRHRLPFRIPAFNREARAGHGGAGGMQDPSQERRTGSAVRNHQENALAGLSRENEIPFPVPDPGTFFDVFRAFIDEDAVLELRAGRPPPAPPLLPCAVRLNAPPVHTLDIPADAVVGDGGEFLLAVLQASGDGFGRLVVIQTIFHKVPEFRAPDDLHALVFAVFSANVRFVVGFGGIIAAPHLVASQFVR